MEPTVLAGAIEFSPAEIALFFAVLAAAFLAVTSPGWLVVAVIAGRRPVPGATAARRRAARGGGALAGLALSAVAGSVVNRVLDVGSPVFAVLGAWGACWALAALLHHRVPAATDEGWGR